MSEPLTQVAGEESRWTSTVAVHYDAKRPLSRYIRWYLLLSLAVSAVWAATNGILMPNQIQILEFGSFFAGADAGVDLQALTELGRAVASGEVTPTAEQTRQLALLSDFEAARANGLALVTTTSAIIVMILQPVIGVLSDRTRSRLGRCAPWILLSLIHI